MFIISCGDSSNPIINITKVCGFTCNQAIVKTPGGSYANKDRPYIEFLFGDCSIYWFYADFQGRDKELNRLVAQAQNV